MKIMAMVEFDYKQMKGETREQDIVAIIRTTLEETIVSGGLDRIIRDETTEVALENYQISILEIDSDEWAEVGA